MNLEETDILLRAINSYYQRFQMNPLSKKAWQFALAEDSYEEAKTALVAYVRSNPHPPTVADIVGKVKELRATRANTLTAEQAFGITLEAIKRFGYYREEDAKKSLPAHVWATVKTIGWKNLCASMIDDQPTLRAQFRNAFNGIKNAEKQREEFVEVMKINGTARQLLEMATGGDDA